jgi:hypothetical protein
MENVRKNLALWEEPQGKAFDFESLKQNSKVQTVMNIPVKVDKVLYDLTGETCVGISGTFVFKGIRVRGVWDSLGNLLNFEKTGIMFGWEKQFEKMFYGCTDNMFRLLTFKEVKDE